MKPRRARRQSRFTLTSRQLERILDASKEAPTADWAYSFLLNVVRTLTVSPTLPGPVTDKLVQRAIDRAWLEEVREQLSPLDFLPEELSPAEEQSPAEELSPA